MRTAIIGCTHAGTAAALAILSQNRSAEVTIFERNATVSFLSCGIAVGVRRLISMDGMFYSSAGALVEAGAEVMVEHSVESVDFRRKTVTALNLRTQSFATVEYDQLVIATGSIPVVPAFCSTLELEHQVYFAKSYVHGQQILEKVKSDRHQHIAILGGGYIGVELAEAFAANGFTTSLIEGENRLMKHYYDEALTAVAEQDLACAGVSVFLGNTVRDIALMNGKLKILLKNGALEADAVIVCIGCRPNTDMLLGAAAKQGLTIDNQRGAIIVDKHSMTSIENVYAIGDAATCLCQFGEKHLIPLATNAIRQALAAATAICNSANGQPVIPCLLVSGNSQIKICGKTYASTGTSLEAARTRFGDDAASIHIKDRNKPEFMSEGQVETCILVYQKSTKILLGAQFMGSDQAADHVQVAAIMIQANFTLLQVIMADLAFNPYFGKPQHIIQTAATQAVLGVQGETFKQ